VSTQTADLSVLVDGAYAAALDDGLWLDWSMQAARAFGGVGATFWVMNTTNAAVERFALLGSPEALMDDYLRNWSPLDPQVPFVAGLDRARVYTSGDHIDPADRDLAGYLDWQRRVGKVDHHLAAAVVLDGQGYFGGVSMHRSVADGPASERDRWRLTAILPDLQRAMQLGFRHNQLLGQALWAGLAPQHDHQVAFLIDERGRVRQATDGATRLMSGQNDLTVRQAHLRCADAAADRQLAALIARATQRNGARSGAMRVTVRPGTSGVLVVYPLAWERRTLAPHEAAALVRVIMPQGGGAATRLYREAFDLTAREAELAGLLMERHSIESAAGRMRIAIATARLHLRHVLEKTGTSRQSDLIYLLSRF
jgi:DNA-binding CsgD family transcriptional regulator